MTSAQDHAFEGGDIGKVAAPGHGDMSVIGHEVVGWIKVDPAVIGQVHREPGVGGIRANQVFFVGGGLGLEVAADIARGQTHSAEATDGQMGKVLTYAFAVFEHTGQWRGYGGESRHVVKVVVDALGEVANCFDKRTAC